MIIVYDYDPFGSIRWGGGSSKTTAPGESKNYSSVIIIFFFDSACVYTEDPHLISSKDDSEEKLRSTEDVGHFSPFYDQRIKRRILSPSKIPLRFFSWNLKIRKTRSESSVTTTQLLRRSVFMNNRKFRKSCSFDSRQRFMDVCVSLVFVEKVGVSTRRHIR